MKRFVSLFLAAALLCAGCMTSCQSGGEEETGKTSSATEVFTPHRFSRNDLTVNGKITLGMTAEEVKEILGEPDSEGDFPSDNFIYGSYTAMTYGGLSLMFYDIDEGDNFTLGAVSSDAPEDLFAGGLHAGSRFEDVKAAFTSDPDAPPLLFQGDQEPSGEYLYGNYTANDFLTVRPKGALEYAYVNRYSVLRGYDTEYMMEYYCGDPLNWNEDETAYEGEIYSMVFYMDSKTDLVKSIRLGFDKLL